MSTVYGIEKHGNPLNQQYEARYWMIREVVAALTREALSGHLKPAEVLDAIQDGFEWACKARLERLEREEAGH